MVNDCEAVTNILFVLGTKSKVKKSVGGNRN